MFAMGPKLKNHTPSRGVVSSVSHFNEEQLHCCIYHLVLLLGTSQTGSYQNVGNAVRSPWDMWG